jgi:hypothetical protein
MVQVLRHETSSPTSGVRQASARLAPSRKSIVDSVPLTPRDLFSDLLAEAVVRRIEQRLNDLPRLLEIEEAARYLGLTVVNWLLR